MLVRNGMISILFIHCRKKSDPHFQSEVINSINFFLKMGDHAYSLMRETYGNYTSEHIPPLIEKFYAFEGGKPPARYTKNYKNIALISDNCIHLDFKEKRRIILK